MPGIWEPYVQLAFDQEYQWFSKEVSAGIWNLEENISEHEVSYGNSVEDFTKPTSFLTLMSPGYAGGLGPDS